MTLNIIGIGLNDEKDITVKGLELVKKSEVVYLEAYTAMLNVSIENLEKFYGKKIILADRELVEQKAEETILKEAESREVSFLVVGDPMSATTHIDLMLRAKELGIRVNIIHNASVLTAVGVTGLQLYKFGKTASLPYPQESFKPETAYDVVKGNLKNNFHTLILLDLNLKEKKSMSVNEAIKILLEIEEKRNENIFISDTKIVACARLGGEELIKYGKVAELQKEDFGKGMHCLIVPAKLHFKEEEALESYRI